MLIPLKGGKWAEISIVVEKEVREYDLGLVKVVEIDRKPVYALLKDVHDGEEVYYEISKFIASLIKEGSIRNPRLLERFLSSSVLPKIMRRVFLKEL